jgi:hypothetical protein
MTPAGDIGGCTASPAGSGHARSGRDRPRRGEIEDGGNPAPLEGGQVSPEPVEVNAERDHCAAGHVRRRLAAMDEPATECRVCLDCLDAAVLIEEAAVVEVVDPLGAVRVQVVDDPGGGREEPGRADVGDVSGQLDPVEGRERRGLPQDADIPTSASTSTAGGSPPSSSCSSGSPTGSTYPIVPACCLDSRREPFPPCKWCRQRG